MRFCQFFAVSRSRWGRVLRLPVGKVDFCLLFKLIKIFSDLVNMGAVQTCASTQQQSDF